MTYEETLSYLYNVAPLFQNIGQGAYKEGLENTRALDAHFGHPHEAFRTIHVAGTNGKGSCSHTLAAILQAAGYKVGLYTSPHLVDFRERIRVNGKKIPEQRVIDFVARERSFFEPLNPSFFELVTALAFQYFKEEEVDMAVVEVGLGGRLDCTNIIQPEISIITNISFDHTQFLGDTLEKIASEKAGIIKPAIPVVIGETNGHPEVRKVFFDKALGTNSSIRFADEEDEIIESQSTTSGGRQYRTRHFGNIEGELGGLCQEANTATILTAIEEIQKQGIFHITNEDIQEGFQKVCELTGLMGRWQRINERPLVICDTGHNVGGLTYIAEQLKSLSPNLRIVVGMVSDKDVRTSLSLLPKDATYYFTQASVKRALPAEQIAALGHELGLKGEAYANVGEAYRAAMAQSDEKDAIFVGGSSFVVADLLKNLGF